MPPAADMSTAMNLLRSTALGAVLLAIVLAPLGYVITFGICRAIGRASPSRAARSCSVGVRMSPYCATTLETKIPPRDLVPQNFRSVRVMSSYLEGLAG